MKTASDTPASQVCRADGGQFIAFWRGRLVYKLDGSLRYFDTEQSAWSFLQRRDSVSDSMVGPATGRPAGRNKSAARG
jgi:hypothetical protein